MDHDVMDALRDALGILARLHPACRDHDARARADPGRRRGPGVLKIGGPASDARQCEP
jgi:hypothetical protein